MVSTWRESPRVRSCWPTISATRPPIPTSTSSKTRVGTLPSWAITTGGDFVQRPCGYAGVRRDIEIDEIVAVARGLVLQCLYPDAEYAPLHAELLHMSRDRFPQRIRR